MIFPRLLAKSSRSPDSPRNSETLMGHLEDVGRVAQGLTEDWGAAWLGALGLSPEVWTPRLGAAALRGSLLHDVGKANDQFQRMVRGQLNGAQAFRHELVSILLLERLPSFRDWLFEGCEPIVLHAALCAIAGHHLKLADGSAVTPRAGSGVSAVQVLTDHPDFRSILASYAVLLGLDSPPALPSVQIRLSENPTAPEVRSWLRSTSHWWHGATPAERAFVAAIKATVIASDVAGSAIPRMGGNPTVWARSQQKQTCVGEDLARIAHRRVPPGALRPFQRATAETDSRVTLVRAGCGSGKTVAAYLWAARWAAGHKLFFCYPTTGTTTEGFINYVPPGEAEAELVHSRAQADLAEILTNTAHDDPLDQALRFASLAAWQSPIVLCTTDTVLGLLQNNRRGLFAFPSIANGAFVFDEIHQYDDRLFDTLLRFLAAFTGAPVLLMTASLQPGRLDQLRRVTDAAGNALAVIDGPAELERIPRYNLRRATLEHAWQAAEEVTRAGGRVLWVVNQVDRASASYAVAAGRGLAPLLYHSRFRYVDRLTHHRAVIDAFADQAHRGVLALTTQVCEISLDLSADLLITDQAPIPALIQRLGRLNRRVSEFAPGEPKPALILKPPNALPYEQEDLARADTWLDRVVERPTSQADLGAAFIALDQARSIPAIQMAWLDGGPFAAPAPLREEGGTIDVLLSDDAPACRDRSGHPKRAEITRLSIPMLYRPVMNELHGWQRLGGAFVAPAGRISYTKEEGARWS